MPDSPLTKTLPVNVRRATESDLPAFAELRAQLWADQIEKGSLDNPDTEPAQLLADTLKFMTRRRTTVFLAYRDDQAAGYAISQIKVLPGSTDSTIASVEEIFVRKGDRRRGLATKLAQNAMSEFREAGVKRIQLRVLDNNKEGRAFWDRMGFLPNIVMYEHPGKEF